MVASRVMCGPPFGVHDGALPDFYNAVTRAEPNRFRCLDQLDVRPLKTVSMHIVSDFAE